MDSNMCPSETEQSQCQAYTRSGERCTRSVPAGKRYCWQHQPKIRRWLKRITIGGIIATALTIIGLIADLSGLGILPIATTTPTILPTVTDSLPCQPAGSEEALIIIAPFEGAQSVLFQNRLIERIQSDISQRGLTVRVEHLASHIQSSSEAERMAAMCRASVVIWGWQDEEGVRLKLMDAHYQATEATLQYQWGYDYYEHPETVHELRVRIIPEETAFLSLFSIGASCYHNDQLDCALHLFEAAIESGHRIKSVSDQDSTAFTVMLPYAYLYKGLTNIKLHKFSDAIPDFDQAITYDNEFRGYAYRGWAFYHLGEFRNALADAEKATVLAPQSFETRFIRGWINKMLYDQSLVNLDFQAANQYFEVAEAEYTELISWGEQKLDSSSLSAAYNSRGNLYLSARRYNDALRDYEQAELLTVDNFARATVLVNKGRALAGLRQYVDAIGPLDQAVALEPNLAAGYYERGMTHLAVEELEQGISDLQHYLDLAPNAVDHQQVEIRITMARSYGPSLAANSLVFSAPQGTEILAPTPGHVTRVDDDFVQPGIQMVEIYSDYTGYQVQLLLFNATLLVQVEDELYRGQRVALTGEPLPNLDSVSMIFAVRKPDDLYVWANDLWTTGGYPPFSFLPAGVPPAP